MQRCRTFLMSLVGLTVLVTAILAGPSPQQKEGKRENERPKATETGGFFADLYAQAARGKPALPEGIPAKVGKVLAYVDKHSEAMDGYEGGRNFGNFEKRLPQNDRRGRAIKYREWDVNPLRPGVNRGAERLVTGNDGSAYYTDDHYKTFTKIR